MATNTAIEEKAQAGDTFPLTREAMELLAPWLHETLTAQDRHDDNADRCQLLTEILRLSHDLYGTPAPSRDTCICRG
ncbi:hypothetical protein [Streptomyces sp. TE5632]